MIGGTGFRRRSVGALIEDIRRKRDFFRTNRFWLADSNFGTSPAHAESVLEALISADLGCFFTALCRVEIGGRKHLLDLMRRAGVVTISIGMEALEDARLRSIEKRQTLTEIRQAITGIHEHGMAVFGLFMVGFDGDTDETPWKIASFCEREAVEGLSIYCLSETPSLPGRTLPRHRICETNLDYYSGHFVTTFPKDVRASVLEKNVFEALLSFYGPRRLASEIVSPSSHGLRFLIPLGVQMRRIERISRRHQETLKEVEAKYYGRDGRLNLSLLVSEPLHSAAVNPDTLAAWEDAIEGVDQSATASPAGSALPILSR